MFLQAYEEARRPVEEGGKWRDGECYVEIWRYLGQDIRVDWSGHHRNPKIGEDWEPQWEKLRPHFRILESLSAEHLTARIQDYYPNGGWFQFRIYSTSENARRRALTKPLYFYIEALENEMAREKALSQQLLLQQEQERQQHKKELELAQAEAKKQEELRRQEQEELRRKEEAKLREEAEEKDRHLRKIMDEKNQGEKSLVELTMGLVGNLLNKPQQPPPPTNADIAAAVATAIKESGLADRHEPHRLPPWQRYSWDDAPPHPAWDQPPWMRQQPASDPRVDALERSVDRLTDLLERQMQQQTLPQPQNPMSQFKEFLEMQSLLAGAQQKSIQAIQPASGGLNDAITQIKSLMELQALFGGGGGNNAQTEQSSMMVQMLDKAMPLLMVKMLGDGVDPTMLQAMMGNGGGQAQPQNQLPAHVEEEELPEPDPPESHQSQGQIAEPQQTSTAQASSGTEGMIVSLTDSIFSQGLTAEQFVAQIPPNLKPILSGQDGLVERVRSHPNASPGLKSIKGKRWLREVESLLQT